MAKLKSTGGEHLAVWDGQRWISIKGEKGDPGTSLTVKGTKPTPADLPATSTAGEAWIVAGAMYVFDGTAWNNIGNVTGPKGDPGSAGPKGDAGVAGAAGKDGTSATVRVGAVAEGPVAVTNTGTNAAAVLNFTIPKGDPGIAGPKGDAGATPAISIGTTTTLATGSPATVTQTGTTLAPVLSFGIPTGPKGDAGAAGTPGVAGKDGTNGTAATVTVGTVKTLAAGQPVTVVNSGTTSAAVLDISIPQGSQGIQGVAGADGKAATVALGTVTQGTTLGVTNSGTSSAAVFNFTLVKGDKGDTGAAGKDGSGVTITGTQNGGTWPPTSPYTKGDMILIGTPVPTGVPAGTLTGHGMVHDGVAWANVGSIQGPAGPKGDKGDAGPQAVSADANNYSRLGTDSKIFTPTPTIPAAAVANPLTDGTAAPGVSLKYAREDHVHPLPTLTALGAAAATHTHPATAVTGLAAVATSGKYSDLTGAPAAFTLPEASATVLGGIKVGTGLSIATGGVLSATAQSPVDATTTVKGVVMLADATAITAGTTGKIPDAGQLKAQVDPKAPKASPAFTGTVHIPAGTAAAPSLVFTGDVDTGVFAPSANSVGLSAGGVSAVEATATGVTLHGTLTAGGLKYPATKGTKDQVLASDGAGNVEWHTVTAGTSYTLPAATALALGGVKVADPAAVTLGAAGYVVDAAQLKTANDLHVLKAGDTMTGALIVKPETAIASPDGAVQVIGEGQDANVTVQRNSDANKQPGLRFKRSRGTAAAPTPVQEKDTLGAVAWHAAKADGTYGISTSITAICTKTPIAGDMSIKSDILFGAYDGISSSLVGVLRFSSDSIICFKPIGIGWTTPTYQLEVGGASMLRGTLDVVGNITSTGTAHSFTAKSIPVTALSAFPTVPTATPASQTATGVAGQVQYDANYLYLAIGANDWRRIPWTDWHGNTLPGAGAGATDTALPWTATPGGGTAGTPNVGAYVANAQTTAIAPLGKIVMSLGTAVPALATGVKVQYRIHGGNWVDATVSGYWSAGPATAYASRTSFIQMAAAATDRKAVVIDGPPPNVPYLTRMAWVSSLGVGVWSAEYTAVTPTA